MPTLILSPRHTADSVLTRACVSRAELTAPDRRWALPAVQLE